MEQPTKFSTAHRKAVADMFSPFGGKIRERALNDFDRRHEELHDSLFKECVSKTGASKLIAKIASLKKNLEEDEQSLNALGFKFDYNDNLVFSDDAPDELSDSLDETIEKEIGTRKEIERKCDEAYQKVWLAATPEDVQAIVSGLFV